MATIDSRHEQMFPTLTTAEIDRIRRFGTVQRYAKGALLFKTGEVSPGMFVVISGTVAVSWRDGLGHMQPIVEQGPGEFLAEVSQLSGRPSLVDASAKTDVEALLIPTAGLRALLIAEAEIGERIMRALRAPPWCRNCTHFSVMPRGRPSPTTRPRTRGNVPRGDGPI